MHPIARARRGRAWIAAACAALLLLPAGASAADGPLRIVGESPPLTMTMLDMMEPGPSLGDMRIFSAPATTDDGHTGTRWFASFTTDMMGEGDTTEDRIGLLVLELGGDDTIVIGGVSVIVEEGKTIPAGIPLSRPILGGTGAYAGIRGEAVTVRAEDGSYRDELTVLAYGEPADDVTLTYSSVSGSPVYMDMDADGDAGMGMGDMRIADRSLRGEDGMEGISQSAGVRVAMPADGSDTDRVIGLIVQDLGGGDRIFAAGLLRTAGDGTDPAGETNARAIIGGTGRFAGARGVLTSTSLEDGELAYTAQLTTAAVPGVAAGVTDWSAEGLPGAPVDLVMPGDAPALGDMRTWSYPLATPDGTPGTSDGLLFNVDMAAGDDPGHDRLGLWFDRFTDGSQIAFAWSYTYDDGSTTVTLDQPSVGPIVGGTGRFAGVAGEVTLVRHEDGSTTHTFHFTE